MKTQPKTMMDGYVEELSRQVDAMTPVEGDLQEITRVLALLAKNRETSLHILRKKDDPDGSIFALTTNTHAGARHSLDVLIEELAAKDHSKKPLQGGAALEVADIRQFQQYAAENPDKAQGDWKLWVDSSARHLLGKDGTLPADPEASKQVRIR